MRKLTFLIISLLVLAGGAYALTLSLFPDTPLFPRIPTSDGTIGGAITKILGISDLGNYAGDGTVQNSLTLSGISGTGYLKKNDCSALDPTQKWTGIDADGKAICGSSTPLLVYYGTISEQGCAADIYHANNATPGTTNTGDTLMSGDIVKTGACGLTIAFSDLSILRLDADTTVSLDVFTMPSDPTRTIASAIMSNGSLWGRILTETGVYSIGTDKIVAGVRGTSISLVSTGASNVSITKAAPGGGNSEVWTITKEINPAYNTELTIVDSTMTAADGSGAASIICIGNDDRTVFSSKLSIENRVSIPQSGCPKVANDTKTKTEPPSTLYTVSNWIKQNTYKDIGYMGRLIDMNVSPRPVGYGTTKEAKILNELISTLPTSPEVTGLIHGTTPDELDENKDITTAITTTNPTDKLQEAVKKSKQVNCRGENKSYWELTGSSVPHGDCQEKTLIAMADYTVMSDVNRNLFFLKGSKSTGPMMEVKKTIIYDDGNFYHSSISQSSDFNRPTDGIWESIHIQGPLCASSPDCQTFFTSASGEGFGFTSFYLPIGSTGIQNDTQNISWKRWSYPNGIYFRKNLTTEMPYPDSAAGGVSITTTSQYYISYPLSALPGGAASLANKTVTIELMSSPTTNNATILDMGSTCTVKWKVSATSYWNLSGIGCTMLSSQTNGKIIQVRLSASPISFIIGNSSVSSFMNPIGSIITRISISN